MRDLFCKLILFFTITQLFGLANNAFAGHCYKTSDEVRSSALIRNKWKQSSFVCGRFKPSEEIKSKGDCKNRYCPVVLDGSTRCGKRGWIHQSLIERTVCEGEAAVNTTAPEVSTRPVERPANGSPQTIAVVEDEAAGDDVAIDLSGPTLSVNPQPTAATGDRIDCFQSKADYLNVRFKAGVHNRSCGKMMRGDKLASKGECEDGWCPVDIKNCGGRGWIAQRFLDTKTCERSEVSSDFGLSAGVYWEDESYPDIGMRPGFMGQNDGGSSCSPSGIKQSRCQRLIKMNAHAALGLCLPDGDAIDLEHLMRKHKISAYSGKIPTLRGPVRSRNRSRLDLTSPSQRGHRRALSKVLLALDRIGGGLPHMMNSSNGVEIIFDDGSSRGRYSRRYGNQIQLRRGGQNRAGCSGHSKHGGTDNVALIMHELAHYIGNPNGYRGLMRATGGRYCMVSNYANNNQGEHFAEVLAAYVLMPERFKGKGRACDKAFDFMKGFFGEPRMTKSCIARKRSYTVPGTGRYDENNRLQERAGSVD